MYFVMLLKMFVIFIYSGITLHFCMSIGTIATSSDLNFCFNRLGRLLGMIPILDQKKKKKNNSWVTQIDWCDWSSPDNRQPLTATHRQCNWSCLMMGFPFCVHGQRKEWIGRFAYWFWGHNWWDSRIASKRPIRFCSRQSIRSAFSQSVGSGRPYSIVSILQMISDNFVEIDFVNRFSLFARSTSHRYGRVESMIKRHGANRHSLVAPPNWIIALSRPTAKSLHPNLMVYNLHCPSPLSASTIVRPVGEPAVWPTSYIRIPRSRR